MTSASKTFWRSPSESSAVLRSVTMVCLPARQVGLRAVRSARPHYPTFAGNAAALMHSLAPNHALVDGNKRLAWAATRVFCLLNGHDLAFTVDDAELVES